MENGILSNLLCKVENEQFEEITPSDISELCNMLESSSLGKINEHISMLTNKKISISGLHMITDVIESHFLQRNARFLSGVLFQLYDRLGNDAMARFYLQYCVEEYSRQSEFYSIIDKYIRSSPEHFSQPYYEHDGEFTYQFNDQEKKYSVHSFSNEIGNNMTLLITPYGSIIFDCGAKCQANKQSIISKNEIREFFAAYNVEVISIKAVFISHAHLDHYGSISSLIGVGVSPYKFFTDEKTKEIVKLAAGEDLLRDAQPPSAFFSANGRIKVHAFDNGHILGSQGYAVRFDNITVIYTGDYCTHVQSTVDGWDLQALQNDDFVMTGVDCLITESTYGRKTVDILPHDAAEKAFSHVVSKLIQLGWKVFLPAFAIGRSQELVLRLNNQYRVLIDGLAIKMCQVFDSLIPNAILNGKARISVQEGNKIDNFELNDIIIASSGMLAENSTSDIYLKSLLETSNKVGIIRTGYLDSSEESYGYEQLLRWTSRGHPLFDIPLSAHASYHEICELIHTINPKNIVAVHGSGIIHSRELATNPHNRLDNTAIEIRNELLDEKKTLLSNPECSNKSEANSQSEIQIGRCMLDASTIAKWKNVTVSGKTLRKKNIPLSSSQSFLTSVMMLFKFLKRNPAYSEIVDVLNSFNNIDDFFDYLVDEETNGFTKKKNEPKQTAVISNITTSDENSKEASLAISACTSTDDTTGIELQSVAEVFLGATISAKDCQKEENYVYIVKPQNIFSNIINFEKAGTSFCSVDAVENKKAILSTGDILVRLNGRCNWAVVDTIPRTSVANHNIAVIRAKPGYEQFMTQIVKNHLLDSALTQRDNMTLPTLRHLQIIINDSMKFEFSDILLSAACDDNPCAELCLEIRVAASELVSYAKDIGLSNSRLSKSILFAKQYASLLDLMSQSEKTFRERLLSLKDNYSEIVMLLEKCCSEEI